MDIGLIFQADYLLDVITRGFDIESSFERYWEVMWKKRKVVVFNFVGISQNH